MTTKIYIMCPANFATGGPELLHQLAFELRSLEIDAKMFYVGQGGHNYHGKVSPVHDNYVSYNIPYVDSIDDSAENIIIFPETYLRKLNDFHKIRKVIWWLSVDNSLVPLDLVNIVFKQGEISRRILCKLILLISKLPILKKLYKNFPLRYLRKILTNAEEYGVIHLAQSVYAMQFLRGLGINSSYYLSDYLREDYLSRSKIDINSKKNIIAYNPKKGYEFTKEIIKQSKGVLVFVAIEHMTVEQVTDLLIKAKCYIDFGSHPGKDRLPREAALMKCCVITGKQGSAGFFEDLPIPDEYKFENDIKIIPAIIGRLKYCLENYSDAIKDFEGYRNFIYNEPILFRQNVKDIFTSVVLPYKQERVT